MVINFVKQADTFIKNNLKKDNLICEYLSQLQAQL